MHKLLIYLSIYFCLTCFELSFSPSSKAGVQLRQWFKSTGYGVCAQALAPYHVTRYNTPIHNMLSNAPQLSISQKALGTIPEDGNVMPKHVGATILN
jgi:hypothetical protein